MLGNRVAARPAYLYNEFKYAVALRNVDLVREMLRSQTVADEPFPDGRVQSVYYDSIDRALLGQCKGGQGRKVKFRIRRYDDRSDGQLQVKYKDGFAVAKLKASVAFPEPFPATWPDTSWPEGQDPVHDASAIGTLGLSAATLRPVIDVCYRRERFRFRDYRVTFDTSVTGEACDGLVYPRMSSASLDFGVLEVKTSESRPLLPPGLKGLVTFSSLSKFALLMRTVLDEDDVLCKYQP